MAEVTIASASERQNWTNKFWPEFIRESGLRAYMGRTPYNIFRVLTASESGGASVMNIPLMGRLKGRGVLDAEVLDGNEEDLENFNDQVRTRWIRNGVVVPKSTSYRTEIDMLAAARPALKDWAAENVRDSIIATLGTVIVPGLPDEGGLPGTDSAVQYPASTAAQRNTYLATNLDRVIFGSTLANSSSGNWATSLGNVTAAMKLTTAIISLAKSQAKEAEPHIRPFRTEDGREYYVLMVNSRQMRDLKQDAAMQQANRDARERGLDNPIFQDGDLIWDGVIIHEIPEMKALILPGAGSGGVDVGRAFLLGGSAVAIGWEQQPTPRAAPDRDYGFRPGVAIEELRGMKKVSWGGKLYGTVEVLTAAAPNA